jgi:hypothetical protein
MPQHLKTDICDLRLPGTLISEVTIDEVDLHLPLEIRYACCYWVYHLQQGNVELWDKEPLHVLADTFLRKSFLHWLEALSLMEKASEGVLMTQAFYSSLTVSSTFGIRSKSAEICSEVSSLLCIVRDLNIAKPAYFCQLLHSGIYFIKLSPCDC